MTCTFYFEPDSVNGGNSLDGEIEYNELLQRGSFYAVTGRQFNRQRFVTVNRLGRPARFSLAVRPIGNATTRTT